MFSFFANIFGYLLNVLYLLVKNYGLAIILFSIILKIILLPLSIKQQTTIKKTSKIQGKLKELQVKYKNNPEKLNQETFALYKQENMSPFSGCLSGIVQIILILSIFFLVKSPLTYMKKIDPQIITDYTNEIALEAGENQRNSYPEISIIQKKGSQDERVYINMEFLGLDLSKVPTQNLSDWKAYVIPVLYVISSFVSMRLTTSMQNKAKQNEINATGGSEQPKNEMDAVTQANKSMSYIMPIMSISIAIIAPLGLALYWLINNILMIVERLAIDKYLAKKEDKANA